MQKIQAVLEKSKMLYVAEVKLVKYVYHKGIFGIGRGWKLEGKPRWEQVTGGNAWLGGENFTTHGQPAYRSFEDALDATRGYSLKYGLTANFLRKYPDF